MPSLDKYKIAGIKMTSVLKRHFFLIGIISFSFVLRMLWLRTIIFFDEGFFGYHAMLWLQGYPPYAYSTPSHGPLLHMLYLMPMYFFGNSIIPVRMLNNILFLFSIIILFLLARDWYGKRVGLISAFFYGVFMNVPVFEAQAALSESFSVPFVVFSLFFFNKYTKNSGRMSLVVSGMLMSISLLVRLTQGIGIFLLLFMTILTKRESGKKTPEHKFRFAKRLMPDVLTLVLGVLVPILLITFYFWSQGILYALIERYILRRFVVAGSQPNVPFGVVFLILTEGLPLWLFSLFGLIICVLRLKRYDIFLIAWVFLFLGVACIPPNFGHHFTQIIAPSSVLSSIGLTFLKDRINSRSPRVFFGKCRKYATELFILSILVLSFVSSIFFQIQHYPHFRIHWGPIHWQYGGSPGLWSYEEQLELGNFLKSNAPTDRKILIHGRWATPYWLSGHRAPSKYVTTVRDPSLPETLNIPEREFQRIVDMVKNGDFEYIVISFLGQDSITLITPRRYFYIKTIVTAQIFSKYNSEGQYIHYSFIEKLPSASKEYELENGTVRDIAEAFSEKSDYMPKSSKLTINDELRDTIRQLPVALKSMIRYNNISIPPNSRVEFGFGIEPWAWDQEGGDGVRFEICIEENGITEKLFSHNLNPGQNIEEREWGGGIIDLAKYTNKAVNITFITTPGPTNDTYDDWAHWSSPMILVKDR